MHYRSMVMILAVVSSSFFEASGIQQVSIGANAGLSTQESGLVSKNGNFMRALTDETPAMRKGRTVEGSHRADCDLSEFNETHEAIPTMSNSPAEPRSNQTSYSWRVRIVQPCKAGRDDSAGRENYEWDVYNVEFYKERCENATSAKGAKPLAPSTTLASGRTHAKFNKELAFDADPQTKWQGVADHENKVWISARFSSSQVVQCVKLIQCDCLRSARAVAVDYVPDWSSDEVWYTVPSQAYIDWGEESKLDIPPLGIS